MDEQFEEFSKGEFELVEIARRCRVTLQGASPEDDVTFEFEELADLPGVWFVNPVGDRRKKNTWTIHLSKEKDGFNGFFLTTAQMRKCREAMARERQLSVPKGPSSLPLN